MRSSRRSTSATARPDKGLRRRGSWSRLEMSRPCISKNTDRLKTSAQSAQTLALRGGTIRSPRCMCSRRCSRTKTGWLRNLIEASGGGSASSFAQWSRPRAGKTAKVEGAGSGRVYLAPETARLFDQAEQLAERPAISLRHRRVHASGNLRWRVAPKCLAEVLNQSGMEPLLRAFQKAIQHHP